MKTEGIEGRERIGNYKRLVVGGSVKNPRKSKESSPLPVAEYNVTLNTNTFKYIKSRYVYITEGRSTEKVALKITHFQRALTFTLLGSDCAMCWGSL